MPIGCYIIFNEIADLMVNLINARLIIIRFQILAWELHGLTIGKIIIYQVKLDRAFNWDNPNIVRVSDFTYIKIGEDWLYLCMIIDLYGRKLISRQTSCYIDRHLVYVAIFKDQA